MSQLPWLKNKEKNAGGGAPIERIADSTHPDKEGSMDEGLMNSVVDEFFQAIEKKDKALLRDALTALVLHIQEEDEKQDQEDMS